MARTSSSDAKSARYQCRSSLPVAPRICSMASRRARVVAAMEQEGRAAPGQLGRERTTEPVGRPGDHDHPSLVHGHLRAARPSMPDTDRPDPRRARSRSSPWCRRRAASALRLSLPGPGCRFVRGRSGRPRTACRMCGPSGSAGCAGPIRVGARAFRPGRAAAPAWGSPRRSRIRPGARPLAGG